MSDLEHALADISAIRGQVARATEFRGYGPATLSATAALAFAAALLQIYWFKIPAGSPSLFIKLWIITAGVSVVLIGSETVYRSLRLHSGLADDMLQAAVEQFLPSLAAGAILTFVLFRFVPAALWMLPGLWQILFSLGAFSSCRFLPRATYCVGLWYLATGFACLIYGQGPHQLSPWLMAIPFGVGQFLVAVILLLCYRRDGTAMPVVVGDDD
jgi:hypothetical protein